MICKRFERFRSGIKIQTWHLLKRLSKTTNPLPEWPIPGLDWNPELLEYKAGVIIFWDIFKPLIKPPMPHRTTQFWTQRLNSHKITQATGIDVLLLHDSANSQAAHATQDAIREQKQELPDHPPCSSDHAPRDFHFFGTTATADADLRSWKSDGQRFNVSGYYVEK